MVAVAVFALAGAVSIEIVPVKGGYGLMVDNGAAPVVEEAALL